jgi:AbrB family looped-hinge helix DNA binding protein
MSYSTTLTQKGQMTLPAAYRKRLGVEPGERVMITIEGDRVVIQKDDYQQKLSDLRAKAQKHLQAKGMHGLSIEEIKRRTAEARQRGDR